MAEFLPGIKAFGIRNLLQNGHFFNEWKNGIEHKGDNDYYIQHFNDEVLKDKTCRQVLADLQKLTGVKNDFSKIILHKHWQERFHPFRVEYELPIELY